MPGNHAAASLPGIASRAATAAARARPPACRRALRPAQSALASGSAQL